jgi:glutamine amidotransferase PdxT
MVALLAATVLDGCGSQNGQSAVSSSPSSPSSGGLPPAVPAAEPALLYNGTGASVTDVSAIEGILNTAGIGYETADSAQLNAMTEPELGGYKLIIIPGGNSITIGESLTAGTTSSIRSAVENYGVHYLGICAGAFFGGYSVYNGVNLTAGVSFNFYAAESEGIAEEPVEISFPDSAPLDMYWQDGPQLSGWGEVVGKFPDGTPAIVEGQSGNGFVIFTGIHPEAPASWWEGMTSTTPLAVDLAYAGTLVQAALDGTQLSHF